jgi:hypothetical protein
MIRNTSCPRVPIAMSHFPLASWRRAFRPFLKGNLLVHHATPDGSRKGQNCFSISKTLVVTRTANLPNTLSPSNLATPAPAGATSFELKIRLFRTSPSIQFVQNSNHGRGNALPSRVNGPSDVKTRSMIRGDDPHPPGSARRLRPSLARAASRSYNHKPTPLSPRRTATGRLP